MVAPMVRKDALFLGDRHAPHTRRRMRALGVVGLLIGVVALGYGTFLRLTRIVAPSLPEATRRSAELPVEVKGPRAFVGPNWMSRERGVWELHLEGEPYAMGFAQARLGSRLLLEQEDYMFDEMAHYVPSKIALFLIRAGVRLRYRHLPKWVPSARQEEMAGLADGMVDQHADFLPAYHRVMFYHSLHDITQGLEHSPLLGCSAFAASGPATQNGHLFIGRNFDFEGPEIFDREKAVLFFKPKGKIPFASVAWVGMSGVVTGLNAQGIYVSVNAARMEEKGDEGMPVEILVRQIMEEARSVDDVIKMVKATPVMVPDFYLVADGKTGEAAVLERSPKRLEVRRTNATLKGTLGLGTGASDSIVLTNHALTQAFSGDAENDRLKRYLTSGARFRRLDELVKKWHGQLDAKKVLEILRDKSGTGGVELGLGNRNALDALIATHSVVVDATNLILWVAEGPHRLGKFRAFDLRKELLGENRPPPADLPEDPIVQSDALRAYQGALAAEKTAERLQQQKLPERALEEARRAEGLEETMPEPHRLVGDLLRRSGDLEGAKREYRRFLELSPPYLKDVEEVKGLLGTL
jgi:isopenicillin-N N-acyltransferase like protein